MQLVFGFTLLSMLILTIGYLLIYQYTLGTIQQQTERSTLSAFKQSDFNISVFRADVEKAIRQLYFHDQIENFVNTGINSETLRFELTRELTSAFSNIMENNVTIQSMYLFRDNGDIIGATSNRIFVATSLEHWFYSSDIIAAIEGDLPKILWGDLSDSKNFDSFFGSYQANEQVIPVGSRLISFSGKSYTYIIINVKEEVLSSVFGNLLEFEPPNTSLYLVSEHGQILSSPDKDLLRQQKDQTFMQQIITGNGSFQDQSTESSKQTVYYRMKENGWTLIKEIPMDSFLRNVRSLRNIILLLFIISIILSYLLSMYWIPKVTSPVKEMLRGMKQISMERYSSIKVKNPRSELGMLLVQFNQMSENIQQLITENARMESEKRELELKTLQSQIHPHFLYNTLNTIKWMAVAHRANNIESAIAALGKMLTSLFRGTSMEHSLQDEIELSQSYILIMNYRYGQNVKIQFDFPELYWRVHVPRLILQPILENCFSHGLKDHKSLSNEIQLSVTSTAGLIEILIKDWGKGITTDEIKLIYRRLEGELRTKEKDGIGLANVHRRLQLHYGSDYGIKITSVLDQGTEVRITIPLVI